MFKCTAGAFKQHLKICFADFQSITAKRQLLRTHLLYPNFSRMSIFFPILLYKTAKKTYTVKVYYSIKQNKRFPAVTKTGAAESGSLLGDPGHCLPHRSYITALRKTDSLYTDPFRDRFRGCLPVSCQDCNSCCHSSDAHSSSLYTLYIYWLSQCSWIITPFIVIAVRRSNSMCGNSLKMRVHNLKNYEFLSFSISSLIASTAQRIARSLLSTTLSGSPAFVRSTFHSAVNTEPART